MRRLIATVAAGAMLYGCSERGDDNAVDLDASASRASADIANYADATRSRSRPKSAGAMYDCADGTVLAVRFDNRADTAAVRISGKPLTLAQKRAASGIWYAGDGAELRGKGRAATWTAPGGAAVDCTAR